MFDKNLEFLIITGMSGAGKTEVINFFEDRGYFCIDNLPASLLSEFVKIYSKSNGKIRKMAFVIDMRDWNFLDDFFEELKKLKGHNINYKILYLDANDEVLLNRFNATRRKHPLEIHKTLLENIQEERKKLKPIREISTQIIDTSVLEVKKLIFELEKKFEKNINNKIKIVFVSFGFKNGIPMDLDLLYDVRFLPNPFYIDDLRNKTGNEIEVQNYVMQFEESKIFYKKLIDMLDFLFPYYKKEGKTYLTIGIGCTGGKHRSVTFANKLYDYYSGNKNLNIALSHRDANKK
ncbi:MAG: RNase adaptor protein RapZ [Fusobacteriia bacterium 4572_132]|nr:MAG: RNase adaptor protein RapZ [Fusobacteriia bacterium 4572_132]